MKALVSLLTNGMKYAAGMLTTSGTRTENLVYMPDPRAGENV